MSWPPCRRTAVLAAKGGRCTRKNASSQRMPGASSDPAAQSASAGLAQRLPCGMGTRLIVTGGTVDKQYDALTGELVYGDTHVPEMLARARFVGEIVIEKILMKDSSDMTAADREKITAACRAAEEGSIVITHGTATMVETAKTLAGAKLSPGQVIVLTGAMVPYSFGATSDAMFNLGTALAYCAALPSGVYIAMNGMFFDPSNVRKDYELGVFTHVSERVDQPRSTGELP